MDITNRIIVALLERMKSRNKDMREIKLYFKDFKGKHPENFALGEL